MSPRASDPAVPYRERLAIVRAEISFVLAQPIHHGRDGPHRAARDEFILQAIGADLYARMREATE
jgi:hypothetical protein